MINAFAINDSRLLRIDDEPADLSSAIWLDLLEPTGEEREMLQEGLGQSLASFLELEDIEASARFFEDEDGLHLHSFFYCEDEENYADLASVAFTIRDGRLFTLRDRELPHSVYIVCVPVANAYWNAMRMKSYSTYLRPKLSN